MRTKFFRRLFGFAALLAGVLVLLWPETAAFAQGKEPLEVYRARRTALMGKAQDGATVIFAIKNSEIPEVDRTPFRQDDYFYYLTGWNEPEAILLLLPGGRQNIVTAMFPSEQKTREILFLPNHNPARERYTGRRLAPGDKDAPAVTGISLILPLEKFPSELTSVLSNTQVIYTVFPQPGEDPRISREQEKVDQLRTAAPFAVIRDVRPIMDNLRLLKSPTEMALIQKAVDASVAAHLAAAKVIQPEVSEYRVAAMLKLTWENLGCERPAYAPIVGSGPNSTVLHYDQDTRIMKSGEVVVIDAAAECDGYAADITRTFPVGGKFSPRQRQVYDLVLGAQEVAAQAVVPGKTLLRDLTNLVKDYFKNSDLRGPKGKDDTMDHYFIHGIGHWLGLEVHDVGDNSRPIDKGMTFTIEPGIYIPEENLGIRIEDDYWVNEEGKVVKLSSHLPSQAEQVEKLMSRSTENTAK